MIATKSSISLSGNGTTAELLCSEHAEQARVNRLYIFPGRMLGIKSCIDKVLFVSITPLVSRVSAASVGGYTHDHRPPSPTLNLYINSQNSTTRKKTT